MKLTKINIHQYKLIRGTNQFITKYEVIVKKPSKKAIIVLLAYILFTLGFSIDKIIATIDWNMIAFAPTKIISPLSSPSKAFAEGSHQSSPSAALHDENTSLTSQNSIRQEILQVFGPDTPKALKLLSCENNSLNPAAVLDDTKLGGKGEDIGVFQINTFWQGVTNKAFLFDPSINIRIAHNIYTRDGNSFKLWTCGRKMGI